MALSIRLPEEIETRLNALALRTGRSKTFTFAKQSLNTLMTLKMHFWQSRNSKKFARAAPEQHRLLL